MQALRFFLAARSHLYSAIPNCNQIRLNVHPCQLAPLSCHKVRKLHHPWNFHCFALDSHFFSQLSLAEGPDLYQVRQRTGAYKVQEDSKRGDTVVSFVSLPSLAMGMGCSMVAACLSADLPDWPGQLNTG